MNIRQTVVLLCFLSLASCKTLEFNSHWRDREVTIDGNASEWQDRMTALEERDVKIGVLNDSKDLYLCLTTTDQDLRRQIMRQGLTLWFDRKGHEEKTFGIHFPLARFAPFEGHRKERPVERPDTLLDRFPPPSDELEIYGLEQDKHHRMNLIEAGGIEIKLAFAQNTLVYEARVPLIDYGPAPYAIGAQAGSSISIGVETMAREMIDRQGSRSPRMGGGPGGGFGGSRRPRGGPEGTRPDGGGSFEPLSVWMEVDLASEAPPDSARKSIH